MKCAKCTAELPGSARFCQRCGAPAGYGRSSVVATTPFAAPERSKPNRAPLWIALGIAALAAATVGVLFATGVLGGRKAAVTEVNGGVLPGKGFVDVGDKVRPTKQFVNASGTIKRDADPVDILDYLKHVRVIEAQRVSVARQQLGKFATLSATVAGQNWMGEMSEDPDKAHKETYNSLQASMTQSAVQWEELSKAFISYPKPVPSSCVALRDKYLDVLGKTSSALSTVGSAFAQALAGDAGKAIELLTQMQGSASAEIDKSCDIADREVADVCNKYKVQKDFDIKADGGAQNPFGIGK